MLPEVLMIWRLFSYIPSHVVVRQALRAALFSCNQPMAGGSCSVVKRCAE
jgi:hypothetical protein